MACGLDEGIAAPLEDNMALATVAVVVDVDTPTGGIDVTFVLNSVRCPFTIVARWLAPIFSWKREIPPPIAIIFCVEFSPIVIMCSGVSPA